MNYTVYYHDLSHQDKPSHIADSFISIVNASEEEVRLVLRFLDPSTPEMENENTTILLEKLLKECGKLKEHDWIDYIFLNDL